ncbi:MAG: bifunctional riboflavin kinase/FAD synthetase [Flavobacteriales bacterium]
MRVYYNLNNFVPLKNAVVTTGTFDGVHLGHQTILKRLIETAKQHHGESVLLTFSPHPRLVLDPSSNIKMLQSLSEKISALEKIGLDHLIIHPFTLEFAKTSSLDFIKNILKENIGANKLVIGYDHHFGRNREGSFKHLKASSQQYGFDVEEIPAQDVDDIHVSSTKIRKALEIGDVSTANLYLSRPFSLTGRVIHGKEIGRSIGFPTANIQIEDDYKVIPKNGVYAVDVFLLDREKQYKGMLNIGNNPTVSNNSTKQNIEVHILNFNKDIYDEDIRIELKSRIRDEKQFTNLLELQHQLEMDKKTCLTL